MRKVITRRGFITGIIAATGLYTWRYEPNWIEYVYRSLPIANLPQSLSGKTLIQLSDIHIGPQVDDKYITSVFAKVRSFKPDIVVQTGDLVSYAGPQTINQATTLLRDFPRGKLGTFAVLGNHDYGHNWSEPLVANQISEVLTQAGCMVLRNQVADVSGLKIVGLDDLWAGRFEPLPVLTTIAPDQPALVLSHNPDTCDIPEWSSYRGWILSGHTHGGQCKPPFLPAPLLPVQNRRYTAGEFALSGGRQLYINRGIGHLLRVRFNVRPEVTIFTLSRA